MSTTTTKDAAGPALVTEATTTTASTNISVDSHSHDATERRQRQQPQPNNNKKKGGRPICDRCHRPTPRACICEGLPSEQISLQMCHVLVLQHPHEQRRKNRSVPLLELTLSDDSMTTVMSRRFGDQHPNAVALLHRYPKALLIFPETNTNDEKDDPQEPEASSSPPLTLSQAKEFCRPLSNNSNDDDSNAQKNNPHKVLIVVLDATWKYTKEMDRANVEAQQYPSHMKRVSLSWDDPARPPQADQAFRFADVRTTPANKIQFLSTAECVAWVLSALEEQEDDEKQPEQNDNNKNNGEDHSLYTKLMKPLDVMVEKWNACRRSSSDDDRDKHRSRKRKLQQPDEKEETTSAAAKDYSYYGNAQVIQEEQEEAMGLASRASFFTNGDQDMNGQKPKKKKQKQRGGRR